MENIIKIKHTTQDNEEKDNQHMLQTKTHRRQRCFHIMDIVIRRSKTKRIENIIKSIYKTKEIKGKGK